MIAKHTGIFLICCWVLITGICSLLLFLALRPVAIESRIFVCGNALMEDVRYRNDSVYRDGKAIFLSNCASCHNPLKDATGPALADISTFRSQEWICRFLTKPKFIPNDKRAIDLRKQFSLRCMKFPQLSCNDIKAMMRYLDYKH